MNLGDLNMDFMNTEEFQQMLQDGTAFDPQFADSTAESTPVAPVPNFMAAEFDFFTDNSTDYSSGYQTPQELVPAQLNFPGLPPPPMQMVQPRYHPAVGWHYPAAAGTGPPPPPMPMQMLNNGYAEVGAAPTSAPAVEFTDNESELPKRSSPKLKRGGRIRTQGPAAYLAAKANRDAGNESPARPTSASPPMMIQRRDGRIQKAAYYQKKAAATMMNCVCKSSTDRKIPRPKNAFILFRSAHSAQITREVGKSNQNISKKAGELWTQASPSTKAKFFKLAEREKEQHAIDHPDYHYKPGRKAEQRFGSDGCTCGAYEANKARYAGRGKAPVQADFADEEPEELDEYVPARRSSPQRSYGAPTAQMTAPSAEAPDLTALGVPLEKQMELLAQYNAQQSKQDRKRKATEDFEEPLAKRRSPRSSAKQVSYQEPDEEDIEINIRKRSSTTLSSIGSADFQMFEGPATRTRSKSLSPEQDDVPLLNTPNVPDYEFDFDNDFAPFDENDTIQVATRSKTSRRSSRSTIDANKRVEYQYTDGKWYELEGFSGPIPRGYTAKRTVSK